MHKLQFNQHELILSSRKWIWGMASKLSLKTGVSIDDLYQEGLIGAIKALRDFDPARGFGFQTYAQHRVHGAMLDSIRRWDWVPRIERQKEKLGQVVPLKIASLDKTLSDNDDIYNSLMYSSVMGENDEEGDLEKSEEVARLLLGLNDRDRMILLLYYIKGLTMKEIGECLGLSESRISQQHDYLIQYIREREGVA